MKTDFILKKSIRHSLLRRRRFAGVTVLRQSFRRQVENNKILLKVIGHKAHIDLLLTCLCIFYTIKQYMYVCNAKVFF